MNLTVLYEDYGPELPVNIEEINPTEDIAEAGAENMTVAEPMRAKRKKYSIFTRDHNKLRRDIQRNIYAF